MHDVDHDDPDADERCYRHPDRETALRCSTCDRPICVDCAITAPVGFKCPDHGRISRAERASVPTGRLARASIVAFASGVVFGVAFMQVPVPLFGIVVAYLLGMAVGELTRRAAGGYRDPVLARIAATAAAGGMAILPAVWLATGSSIGTWTAFAAFKVAAAGIGAFQRAS